MQTAAEMAPGIHDTKARVWTGRIIGGILALFFIFGGVSLLLNAPFAVAGLKEAGFPDGAAVGIAIAELLCAILYLIPRTSVLGAILVTGYLGGATATHVHAGQPFYLPVIFGILFWGALFLRDPQLRALIPLRATSPHLER